MIYLQVIIPFLSHRIQKGKGPFLSHERSDVIVAWRQLSFALRLKGMLARVYFSYLADLLWLGPKQPEIEHLANCLARSTLFL